MIHVLRNSLAPPAVLDALNREFKDKKTELERARDYYGTTPTPTKAFDFKRYREWEVCFALDEVFHDKCAYCESSYRAVDARNVEHFRPKARVTEAPSHPGYWWLAATWANLLPSCPACNQLRRQLAFDRTMTLEEFDLARRKEPRSVSGKANSFPVRDANWVAPEADTGIEDPLLINPCERHPEQHIEWVFDWDRKQQVWEAEKITAEVRPRLHGVEIDVYGKASIAVFGLNRSGLIRERMAHIRMIQIVCKPVVHTIIDLSQAKDAAEWLRLTARLMNYKNEISGFARSDRPYAAMARAFVALFDEELTKFSRAIQPTEVPSPGIQLADAQGASEPV
jgi:hypothetical protein